MERDYKRTAWRLRDAKHTPSVSSESSGRAWSSATFNAYFDLVTKSVFFDPHKITKKKENFSFSVTLFSLFVKDAIYISVM